LVGSQPIGRKRPPTLPQHSLPSKRAFEVKRAHLNNETSINVYKTTRQAVA